MIIGIGVFVLGVAIMTAIALFVGMAIDFQFEIGIAFAFIIASLVGIYTIGKGIAIEFGLI